MPSTHASIHFHIVFSTKNRLPMIDKSLRDDLYGFIGGIVKNQGGKCLAVRGIEDHVHMLVGLKTSHRIDYLMREVKASSSGWIRRNYKTDFNWQKGFGVFSISPTVLKTVEKYVRNQEKHHKSQSFQEEYVDLLKIGNINYDES